MLNIRLFKEASFLKTVIFCAVFIFLALFGTLFLFWQQAAILKEKSIMTSTLLFSSLHSYVDEINEHQVSADQAPESLISASAIIMRLVNSDIIYHNETLLSDFALSTTAVTQWLADNAALVTPKTLGSPYFHFITIEQKELVLISQQTSPKALEVTFLAGESLTRLFKKYRSLTARPSALLTLDDTLLVSYGLPTDFSLKNLLPKTQGAELPAIIEKSFNHQYYTIFFDATWPLAYVITSPRRPVKLLMGLLIGLFLSLVLILMKLPYPITALIPFSWPQKATKTATLLTIKPFSELTEKTDFDQPFIDCAVLVTNIRAFSNLAKNMNQAQITTFLSDYFTRMTTCVHATGGTISMLDSDSIIALWGINNRLGNSVKNAVDAAFLMEETLTSFNLRQTSLNLPAVKIGCGISYGPINFYQTAIHNAKPTILVGEAINQAKSAQQLTKVANKSLLITEHAFLAIKLLYDCSPVEKIRQKGRLDFLQLYAINDRKKVNINDVQSDIKKMRLRLASSLKATTTHDKRENKEK